MNIFGRNTDIGLAIALLVMLGLMVMPLPPSILDFFLAVNITIAILVFVVSLYIKRALDISIFPTLLLILTLFRLSLNISSTRLILLDGYAGQVIESFGTFVVGGDYVVGFIVFIILVLIQFIVIVKGSGRISEVAARFTLDAMPGKQMAIDADLNSGLITESQARQRRDEISEEAEFYGAMDGASKFVKGDAIAGLLITVINILAGFIIGIAQQGLSIGEALKTYTILTIGDGLVSQIPALLIATSAGFVITRSSGGTSLDSQMKTQLVKNPRVLAIVGVFAILFGFLPGMPGIPFIVIGIIAVMSSFFSKKLKAKETVQVDKEEEEKASGEDKIEQYLQVDPIEIEIGYGLISMVDETQNGNLFQKIASTRKYLALGYGVLIPPVRVRDNLQLEPSSYIIKIKGIIASTYEIHTDRYLAMNPGVETTESLEGIPTRDPAFNLPSYWIPKSEKEKAEMLGFTVVDGISVLSTHLQETLKKNFDKILSRQAVKQLLENLKKEYPAVIDDINKEVLSLGTIQKVLQNLLKELIPIKDLVQILEALIDYSSVTKNIDVLTEYVRHSIGDILADIYKDENNIIRAAAIGEELEANITNALQNQKEALQTLGLSPALLNVLKEQLEKTAEKFKMLGYPAIIISSATIRPYLFRLVHSSFQDMVFLSFSELPANLEIEFIDKVEVEYAS
jgi:flagellar biosynthesis protein FlhA